MKLSPKRLFKRNPKLNENEEKSGAGVYDRYKTEWEVRPGGMLVQKRVEGREEGTITVRVSTGHQWHDISIGATSTFGELKVLLSLETGLWPREQRLIFRGKEREDCDHLHMVGVQNMDKVLLLEDPAIKERKLRSSTLAQIMGVPGNSFIRA
ncbi:BAG family molecular chaperone regulator 2 [Carex littledalei]|uniref:BAG family molecular chaperone regulator 2 n=1 Tax=Carex littledalei TaxID=544730 RepID=A0A833RN19_9POAL|nr:BAG family molecular chaperone regulator 2 [Carex littledalei]